MHVATPSLLEPSDHASPMRATKSGSCPYERSPMTGFDALLFTSRTGAKFQLTPIDLQAACRRRADLPRHIVVVRRAQTHRRRRIGHRPRTNHASAFLVDADQRVRSHHDTQTLAQAAQLRFALDVASEQADARDAVLLDPSDALGVQVGAGQVDHNESPGGQASGDRFRF